MPDLTTEADTLFLVKGRNRQLLNEVEQLFKTLPIGHSQYQIKHFIIGQFERCSLDRAHKQCLLEIHTRYHSLLDLHYQYRKAQLDLETEDVNVRECEYRLENEVSGDVFEQERTEIIRKKAQLEIGLKEINLVNIRKSISETLREINLFKEEMDRLAPLRKFPGNYEQCEPEYWRAEYAYRFNQGKRGENLPPLPGADRELIIESLTTRIKQLEDAKGQGTQKPPDGGIRVIK